MSTSLISSLEYTQFADTTARIFYGGKDMPEVSDLAEVMSLYKIDVIPMGTGEQRVYDEIDGETYAHFKGQGVDATKTQTVAGYSKTMYVRRFAAEIDITYEARAYGKEQQVIRKLTSLATFCPQRMALDLTHRLTFATATAYTDMDGESVDLTVGDTNAIVDATHDLTGTTTTYTNIITSNPQFSQGSYEVAVNVGNKETLNNFGEIKLSSAQPVIVTSNDASTVREVRQLNNSMADVDGAHAGITNVYKNMFRHIILPRLDTTATGAKDSTKSKRWFYIMPDISELHLGIWEQPHLKMPAEGNNGEDLHNDNWTFGCRCGYGIAVPSGKGILMSTGLGA